ncbi:MAG: hypothetical protein N3F07_01950 [Candidatus Micrarchaeota archaeon]|nr:hypothetical protein [Candidatus Micrarchaeota archaeon]
MRASEMPDLDQCVLDALSLFLRTPLPALALPDFKRPIVVGSGNAATTGKILFEGQDAIFADESTFGAKLASIPSIDGCILISASGGKHAPMIAKKAREKGLQVVLLTNNPSAPASNFASQTILFPKNKEPYTYNASTYLGMILAKTKESPAAILRFLRRLKAPSNLAKYDAFFILVPERFEPAREMLLTKFDELFGPKVSGRAFTPSQAMHAKTVVRSESELFIGLGAKTSKFSSSGWDIPFPKSYSYAALVAAGYFAIGKIQSQHPPYFKRSLPYYAKIASKMFRQKIKPIV